MRVERGQQSVWDSGPDVTDVQVGTPGRCVTSDVVLPACREAVKHEDVRARSAQCIHCV